MFNPLTRLAAQFIGPIILRFMGTAISSTLVRQSIGMIFPFLLRLPIRNLIQIAFFRPIINGGRVIATSPSAISQVSGALMAIAGVNPAYLTTHRFAFDMLVRIVAWLWLIFSSTSVLSLLSFMFPLSITFLGYLATNVVAVKPICIYLIGILSPFVPTLSWDIFHGIASKLVEILTYSLTSAVEPVKQVSWWYAILVPVTSIIDNYISPHITCDQWAALWGTIGSYMVPYIPVILLNPLQTLGLAVFAIVNLPFVWVSASLSYLGSFLALIPGSLWVQALWISICQLSPVAIPWKETIEWIIRYFGL